MAAGLQLSRHAVGRVCDDTELYDPRRFAHSARTDFGRPESALYGQSCKSERRELRPASAGRSELLILFAFDPWRSAILLVAGDKAGNWKQWYRQAIPRAEQLLEIYLKERAEEEERGAVGEDVDRLHDQQVRA